MKFFTLTSYLLLYGVLFQSSIGFQNINIGLIVDVGSQEGEIVESCMAMAISDVYKTRVALQVRDYGGDSFRSIISGEVLLKQYSSLPYSSIFFPDFRFWCKDETLCLHLKVLLQSL